MVHTAASHNSGFKKRREQKSNSDLAKEKWFIQLQVTTRVSKKIKNEGNRKAIQFWPSAQKWIPLHIFRRQRSDSVFFAKLTATTLVSKKTGNRKAIQFWLQAQKWLPLHISKDKRNYSVFCLCTGVPSHNSLFKQFTIQFLPSLQPQATTPVSKKTGEQKSNSVWALSRETTPTSHFKRQRSDSVSCLCAGVPSRNSRFKHSKGKQKVIQFLPPALSQCRQWLLPRW